MILLRILTIYTYYIPPVLQKGTVLLLPLPSPLHSILCPDPVFFLSPLIFGDRVLFTYVFCLRYWDVANGHQVLTLCKAQLPLHHLSNPQHLKHHKQLGGIYGYHPLFPDATAKDQRGYVSYLKSHSLKAGNRMQTQGGLPPWLDMPRG